MFTLRFRVTFAPPAYAEAFRTLRSLLGPIRAQPGCRTTRLLREVEDDSSLTFIEEWRDRGALEEHLHSEAFRKLVAVLEQASEAPEVEIDDVRIRSGVELMESILAHNANEQRDGGAR
ncbi:MAG: antibiotic biosynthesis monooxygenase [Thermoanaerobaculaceae bacterium]|nr:antibiotic biosynthesis monooxygenase [Thermoanaerobaculaceae bacterium]